MPTNAAQMRMISKKDPQELKAILNGEGGGGGLTTASILEMPNMNNQLWMAEAKGYHSPGSLQAPAAYVPDGSTAVRIGSTAFQFKAKGNSKVYLHWPSAPSLSELKLLARLDFDRGAFMANTYKWCVKEGTATPTDAEFQDITSANELVGIFEFLVASTKGRTTRLWIWQPDPEVYAPANFILTLLDAGTKLHHGSVCLEDDAVTETLNGENVTRVDYVSTGSKITGINITNTNGTTTAYTFS